MAIEIKMVVAGHRYMPSYGNATDGCMDMKIKLDTPEITIQPGETKTMGSGLKVAIPEGYVMKVYVRSSTGIKKHLSLANGTGIIDAGYRDEIKLALYNFGNTPITLKDGDRVCQFDIQNVIKVSPLFVEDDEKFREGDRGGGIGSTGN